MNQKNENDEENIHDDDEAGFQINLPFGLGWLRGDGSHLALLMPVIRWMLVGTSVLYLILRIIEEVKTP